MKTQLFAILALLALSSAAAFTLRGNFESFAQQKLQKLAIKSTSHLSADLLAQIQNQLTSATGAQPIQKVMKLLQELKADIESEQEAADQLNKTEEAECIRNEEAYQAEIDAATAAIAEAIAKQGVAEVKIEAAKECIQKKTEDIALNEKVQAANKEERARNAKLFGERMEDHKAALEAIGECRELIQNSRTYTGAFMQTLAKVRKALRASASAALFAPSDVLNARGSAAYVAEDAPGVPTIDGKLHSTVNQAGANKNTAQKMLDLLTVLENSLVKSRESYEADEKRQQAEFEDNARALEEQHESLVNDLEECKRQLAEQIEELNLQKQNEQKERARKAENEDKLAKTTANCDAKGAKYEKETAERQEEIQVVQQVIEFAEQRIAQLKSQAEYLGARLEHVNEGDNDEKLYNVDDSEAQGMRSGLDELRAAHDASRA